MLLRYFYDEKLAHASYLVGCQATGEAIVIDPGRDVEQYQQVAKAEGLRIVAATETHIHADFVSGVRELAVTYGSHLYLSDEGGKEWTYENIEGLPHRLVKDGDFFQVGNILFEVMHTPGHTPESMSLLVTDRGGLADQPMGIFTGDFVFVGDVGRPDLLEKTTGVSGAAEAGAKQMFASLQRFKQLPDFLQVWPAHGAGSACGKALGAVPSSTVGYEKLFNWALRISAEAAFVSELLTGQPEPPSYFALMKQMNRQGATPLSQLPPPSRLTSSETEIHQLLASGAILLDTRPSRQFASGHISGSINIPYNRAFTNWAGWFIDYQRPLYLLTEPEQVPAILRDLRAIGIDQVVGYFDVAILSEMTALQVYQEVWPEEIASQVERGEVYLIDVRNGNEWEEGHVPGAIHVMLGTLPKRINEIPTDKPLVLQCKGGARSAIAASLLQAHGISRVANLLGGIDRWRQKGLPQV